MHYRNGREVKLGDRVIGKDCGGNPFSGIVVTANASATSCNLQLVVLEAQKNYVTAGDCLHMDDAMPPLPPPAAPQAAT